MNSLRNGFIPPREKAVERSTLSRGRFIAPWDNDPSRFRECSLRNRVFSPMGKATPLNDKVVGKVIVPRKKANKLIFFKGGR